MSKRILVVEDQADNRQILRDLLTSADFEVIEAVDGEAGLAAAAAHRPDLILMDIQLPILDGYEATRRIKADAVILHAIPVIVVTSYALAGDDGKARAAGCDAYISKPYSPRQLLAMVLHSAQLGGDLMALCFSTISSAGALAQVAPPCSPAISAWSDRSRTTDLIASSMYRAPI